MNFGEKLKTRTSELKILLENVAEKIEQATINEDIVGLISLEEIYRSIVLEIEKINDTLYPKTRLV